jgi:hypothetical protein
MNLKDPTDINKAAGLSMLDAEDKRYLTMLPVGYGIVKMQDRWREPFLITFPLVDVKKGSVTDRDLEQYLRSVGNEVPRPPPAKDGENRPRLTEGVLTEDAFALLNDVLANPEDGVRTRYARLGMSADRGTRLKNDLVAKGWLTSKVIQVGEYSRKVVLKLTDWAKETLWMDKGDESVGRMGQGGTPEAQDERSEAETSLRPIPSQRGHEGLRHKYLKRVWAEKLAGEGYQVALEAPRRGGRVDVLAVKGDERIGVEIETGESDLVGNVRNGLLDGFARVIVVATDRTALAKVERALGRAGLLGVGQVEISFTPTA